MGRSIPVISRDRKAKASIASAEQKQQTKPLRVGVIGMGKMGQIRAEVTRAHPDLQLGAICDVDQEKAMSYPNANFYKDYCDLLAADLDIVFVCTYNNVTPKVVVKALDQGKNVFCEKPPGRSVADVEKMIVAEQRNPSLKLQFGFNHRFHYAVIEAKSVIESQRFGKILWMRGIYGKSGGIEFENSWRSDTQFAGGGILLDQGIHMLDLFRFLSGNDFPYVQGLITTAFWNIPLEDNAFAILHNEHGQIAMLHSSATQWKHRFSLEICLQEGYINLNGILSSTRSYGDESLTFARRQFEDESFAVGKPREETVFFDRDDSWFLEVDDFVKAIHQQQPVQSGNTNDALKVMQLIEQIYTTGQRI